MKPCYHFTNKDQLEQILYEGLKPKYGINSQLISDSKREQVYYSVGEEATIEIFAAFHELIRRVLDGRISTELYETYSDEMKHRLETNESVDSWMGDGVYLIFDGDTLVNYNEDKPKDSYTSDTILPENLYVCVLKNASTGEIVSTKHEDIVTYFITKRTKDIKEAVYLAGFFALGIQDKMEEYRNMPLIIEYMPLSDFYNLTQSERNDRKR